MNEQSKRLVLEELRRLFDANYAASDVLDNKLQNILNFSSAIVSLATTIILALGQNTLGILFWMLLIAVLILYIYMFKLISDGMKPAVYAFPISHNLATLEAKYFTSTEERALDQDIIDHLHYIDKAIENNIPKAKAIRTSMNIMFWIVILLLAAV